MTDDPHFDPATACNFFMMTSILGPCSGHGLCVDKYNNLTGKQGVCECDENWSGVGDIINADGVDCHIYRPFIRIGWLILGALYFLHLCLLLLIVLPIARKDGFSKCWGNKQLRIMMIGGTAAPVRTAEGVYRFLTGKMVGTDVFLTFGFVYCGCCFYSYIAPSILQEWLKLVIKQSKFSGEDGQELGDIMKNNEVLLRSIVPVSIIAYAIVIPTLFIEDLSVLIAINIVYYTLHLYMSYFLASKVCVPCGRTILRVMEESIERTTEKESTQCLKLKESVQRIERFIKEAKNNAFTNNILCTAFAVCPLFWNFCAYQLIVGWISGVIIVTAMVLILAPNEVAKKNNILRRLSGSNVDTPVFNRPAKGTVAPSSTTVSASTTEEP